MAKTTQTHTDTTLGTAPLCVDDALAALLKTFPPRAERKGWKAETLTRKSAKKRQARNTKRP